MGRRHKQRGNGTGSIYKRSDREGYVAEVRILTDGNMRRIRRSFPTKKAAALAIPSMRQELMTESVARKSIGFRDLIDKLLDTEWYKQLSSEKQMAYKIAVKKCDSLMTLSDVRRADFETLQGIIRGMTFYPARDVRTVLNKAFGLAMRMDCLERNQAPLLELPKMPQAKNSAFTDEQVQMIEQCHDPFVPYILLMIYMGLRPVELRGMTVEDVHLDERYTDGGRKTAKGVPIAIFDDALPILRTMCEETKTGKLCRMSEDEFYTAFYRCLAEAGVQDEQDHTLTPYACRHTFVTRLTRQGVPQAMIQKAARHTSYKTTQRYTHLDITDVLDAVNKH